MPRREGWTALIEHQTEALCAVQELRSERSIRRNERFAKLVRTIEAELRDANAVACSLGFRPTREPELATMTPHRAA